MAEVTDSALTNEQSQRIIFLLENLFILEALSQGIKVDDVRKLLQIDKWRISNVSKLLKSGKK